MKKQTLTIHGKTVSVYPNGATDAPLLLTFLTPQESDGLAAAIGGKAVLASVDEPDWERAFTPWPAPAVFKKAPDFGGGANDYPAWLTTAVLPEIKQTFRLQPQWQGLLGYSLGGLFAAYSAYRDTPFARIASVSGSLWFDGWADFVQNNTPLTPPQKAYFSVGDQEKNTANPRMKHVEDHTVFTHENWQRQGIVSAFERNSGGHFNDVVQRMAKAVAYLSD